MKRTPCNRAGFKRGSFFKKHTLKVFKNNYFGFSENENFAMRTCNIHILESLGELNLA